MSPLVVCYDGLTGAAAVLGVQRVPGVEAALEFLHLDVVRATTFPKQLQCQVLNIRLFEAVLRIRIRTRNRTKCAWIRIQATIIIIYGSVHFKRMA